MAERVGAAAASSARGEGSGWPLAEAEAELGPAWPTTAFRPASRLQDLPSCRAHLDDIDLKRAADHEKRLRHDVTAAGSRRSRGRRPGCGDIVHLAATSLRHRQRRPDPDARKPEPVVPRRSRASSTVLAKFAQRWKDEPTLGFTHFQPAQLTTVGKRATLLAVRLRTRPCRNWRRRRGRTAVPRGEGTTGTQASFLVLFRGDHEKVKALDKLVAAKTETHRPRLSGHRADLFAEGRHANSSTP